MTVQTTRTLDFRSDTVTRPSPGMLEAMMSARVGDDVYGEDPTVRELEARLAQMFGQQAGLFCASGTMSNQIAIMAQTRPGDAVICSDVCHIYNYEGGGLAANAGVQAQLLSGGAQEPGHFTLEQVRRATYIDDVHHARTRVVAVEDTSNRGGGSLWERERLEQMSAWTRERSLVFHLDGARIFNRFAATGECERAYGMLFTSISVCLSKGLGAPVGSVLLGSEEMITRARRVRKRLGGGMRQAGYLAAAGLYALEHHRGELAQDHELAAQIAQAFGRRPQLFEQVVTPQSNIILARVCGDSGAAWCVARMRERGVWCSGVDESWVRVVTHRDVRGEDVSVRIERICKELEALMGASKESGV